MNILIYAKFLQFCFTIHKIYHIYFYRLYFIACRLSVLFRFSGPNNLNIFLLRFFRDRLDLHKQKLEIPGRIKFKPFVYNISLVCLLSNKLNKDELF